MFFVFFFHLLLYIIMQLHKRNFFSLIILTNQKKKERPPPPKKCRNFWLYWNIILNSSATSDYVNRQFYDLGSHTQVRINIFQILNLCKGIFFFLYKLSFYFIYFSFLARTIIALLSVLRVWQYIVNARVLWSMPFIFIDIQD